ncbi:MAG TPA: hypothetical protein GX714_09555 [Chloroflexi bacterium]|jgi:Flp pilus assembly protein TadG|nr:hypothetical protein [Chloroflexota bacterium]
MRRIDDRHGQDLVEMALLLPLLLALLFGIIEFEVVIWRYNTVSNAAREGAQAGIVTQCDDGAVQAGAARLIGAWCQRRWWRSMTATRMCA